MTRSGWTLCFLLLPAPLLAQVGPLVLPGDDIGEEHYGEPPAVPENVRWMGLYALSDSSWVQLVDVTLQTRPSEEPGEPGTHEYLVEPRSPVLLMIGVGQARVGTVQTSLRYTDALSSASPSREIRVGTTLYRLAIEGPDSDPCQSAVVLTSEFGRQRLYAVGTDSTFSCDEPRFDVHWAGDLDGDGRLDLLATFSPKYSYHPRRLYLSSAARPGNLVGPVALFER